MQIFWERVSSIRDIQGGREEAEDLGEMVEEM